MLKNPLGDWLTTPHQNWHWYMDPISSCIFFRKQPDQWYKGKLLVSTLRCTTQRALKQLYDISAIHPCDPPTQRILPATLTCDRILSLTTVSTSNRSLPMSPQHLDSANSTPPDLLGDHPFYLRLLGSIEANMSEVIQQVSRAIEHDSLLVCTDGSYDPIHSKGAHGWVFATAENVLWTGAGPLDGHKKLSSVKNLATLLLPCTLYIEHACLLTQQWALPLSTVTVTKPLGIYLSQTTMVSLTTMFQIVI
jgi:hypothetical protein